MTLVTDIADPPPLRSDSEGTVRIGRTRVSLDTVVNAFNQGSSVEEIVLRYPSLTLTDTYAAIAYYLRHRRDVDSYLKHRREEALQTRRKIEEICPPTEIRERLMARHKGPEGE